MMKELSSIKSFKRSRVTPLREVDLNRSSEISQIRGKKRTNFSKSKENLDHSPIDVAKELNDLLESFEKNTNTAEKGVQKIPL